MAQISSTPVKTFSIGFEEEAYNELPAARQIAQKCKTDHHELIVKPDIKEILPQLVRHFGEPFADSSAVPTYYLAQMTRTSVTVALTGDGGDESFAGYQRYLGLRLSDYLEQSGSGTLASSIGRMIPARSHTKSRIASLRRFLAVAALPAATRYAHWMTYFTRETKRWLCTEQLKETTTEASHDWLARLFSEQGNLETTDSAMATDVQSYLPYDLLTKMDIMTMANSLEARSPFLDQDVMEFAARLPQRLKLKGRQSKYILKKTCADLLPVETLRRKKMGFGMPTGEWFRGPLRQLLMDTVLSDRAINRGYFAPVGLRQLINEHLDRRNDHGFKLWNLLMLELWHQEFLDR